jgi:hypothetical protein
MTTKEKNMTTLFTPPSATMVAPQLVFMPDAWNRMLAYVRGAVSTEINGFGYVRQISASRFIVDAAEDIFITKQTVTGGEARVSGDAFAKADYQSVLDGRENELHLQWHSHVWGEAYCSSTDMQTIEGYGSFGADWFISLVTNKHGQVFARLDAYRPFRIGCPMEVILHDDIDDETRAFVQGQIDDLVTVAKPARQAPVTSRRK